MFRERGEQKKDRQSDQAEQEVRSEKMAFQIVCFFYGVAEKKQNTGGEGKGTGSVVRRKQRGDRERTAQK